MTSASSAAYSRGLFHRHLVERDLLGALAGDLLVRDGADAEVTLRVRVHVVVGRDAVPHIGLEHGVEAHAGEVDAGIQEHVGVVLEVVTELGAARILENRLQRRQHARAVELLRRAGVDVAQRHVGSRAWHDAERHADDLGAHVLEAGGLGVEGEQLRLAQCAEPALEIFPATDGFVVALDAAPRSRSAPPAPVPATPAAVADAAAGESDTPGVSAAWSAVLRGGTRFTAVQLPQQPAQLVARVQLAQGRRVGRRPASSCSMDSGQLQVGTDGRELA